MTALMTNDPQTAFPPSILFFGCGNMGSAMLQGWLAAGIDPNRFTVVDPFAKNLPDGVRHVKHARDIKAPADIMILAIKPQMLTSLGANIAACLSSDALMISIMAGVSIATLQDTFSSARIVRLMPNLAAAIGKSPIALASQALSPNDQAALANWLMPLGAPIWIEDEIHFDAVTALAGSGPAFVYRFIDALSSGGVALGLPAAVASQLALAMVEGAAMLAAHAPETPQALAARVTSPGGTTAAGLSILDEQDRLTQLVEATLRAARDRGVELGKGG
jgi:pyrroline-5-carboxylate reductase